MTHISIYLSSACFLLTVDESSGQIGKMCPGNGQIDYLDLDYAPSLDMALLHRISLGYNGLKIMISGAFVLGAILVRMSEFNTHTGLF